MLRNKQNIDLSDNTYNNIKICIVRSQWHFDIVDGLINGINQCANKYNVNIDYIKTVMGSFEIPCMLNKIIKQCDYNIYVAVGAIIRGETDHYNYISLSVINGIMDLSINNNVSIGMGIITCDTIQQAKERSGNDMSMNQGYLALEGALSTYML